MDSEVEKCLPIYIELVHKLKINLKNQAYLEIMSEIEPAQTKTDNKEESEILEYLLDGDNIDNLQVFLSDFMEMLVDFSFQ